MKGKEHIIDKIISDARKIAASTHEEGVAKAQEIINAAEHDAKIYRVKHKEEFQKEREDILRRRITAANLEVKKMLLAAKQQTISRAFDQSVHAIKADKEKYKALIKSMLKHASDGDTLTLSESDKDILTSDFIKKATSELGIKVKLNPEYGKFKGGILLSDEKTDKNLTLETELNALRRA